MKHYRSLLKVINLPAVAPYRRSTIRIGLNWMGTCDIHFPFYSTTLRTSRTIMWVSLESWSRPRLKNYRLHACHSSQYRRLLAKKEGSDSSSSIKMLSLVVHISVRRGIQIAKKKEPVLVYKFLFFWAVCEILRLWQLFIPNIYRLTSTFLLYNFMASLRWSSSKMHGRRKQADGDCRTWFPNKFMIFLYIFQLQSHMSMSSLVLAQNPALK